MSKNRYTEKELGAAFEELVKTIEFSEFAPRDKDLDFLSALGIKYREISHSSLLAYLFDPKNPHDLGSRFLLEFIRSLPCAKHLDNHQGKVLPDDLIASIEADEDLHVSTQTEDERIDVSLILPKHSLIVGIEVKIHAGEQQDQLERYQNSLENRDERHKLMVFLTPSGRPAKTAADDHGVSCVNLSWGEVGQQLESSNTDKSSRYHEFIGHCANHFMRRLDSSPPQSQAAKALLKRPVYAHLVRRIIDNDKKLPELIQKDIENSPALFEQFKRLANNRPSLGEIPVEEVEAMAGRVFPKGFEIRQYPEKTTCKEWKIYPKPDGGLYDVYRPNFMIYHYPDSSWNWERRPAVVLVSHRSTWDRYESVHRQLSAQPEGEFLSPKPVGLPRWSCWLRLMATDRNDAPPALGYVVENEAFDEDFIETAEAHLKDIDNRLQRAWKAIDPQQ